MTVRLAVIGAGDVAQRDYLPELHRLSGRVEVVVVCSRQSERARSVAEEFSIGHWTTSYCEAVSDGGVDAVLNLTPFSIHAEVTQAALAADKHVYSEKPLALTLKDADLIEETATEKGLIVVAAPCVMIFPQVRRAQELLASGALGRVHSARGLAFGGIPPWRKYISDPSPFFARDGGPLVDMAVYPLHALTGLLGPVRRVGAVSRRTREAFLVEQGEFAGTTIPVEVDDNWHLIVELESGCLASIQTNNCAKAALSPEVELQGERGTIGLSLLEAQPLLVVENGAAREEHIAYARTAGPDHLLGVEHLVDCIERRTPPILTTAHARHVIDVIKSAQQAAAEGRVVAVTSLFTPPAPPLLEEVSASG